MRVYEERGVKIEDNTSNEQINLVYFLFWTSTYELLCVTLFFWVDFLPWYGDTEISNFGKKYVHFNSKNFLSKHVPSEQVVLFADSFPSGEVESSELRLQAPNVHDLNKHDRLLADYKTCDLMPKGQFLKKLDEHCAGGSV